MNLPQRKMTPSEAFERERAEKLSSTVFPSEKFPNGFKEHLHKAMRWNSLRRMEMHLLSYANCITFERPFMMPEVGIMMEVLKAATPIEMDQTLEENLKMIMEIVGPIQRAWDEIDGEVSAPIKNKINAQLKMGNNVPLGHKIFKDE